MSRIANAKSAALKGNVSEAFKNEAGAIDLASIMVGIIVIGLIGGVIAATVFAVIPWAQDNAAKQQLDSVAAAQSAYIGLTSEGGKVYYAGTTNAGAFGLVTGNKISFNTTQVLFDAPASTNLTIAAKGTGDGAHYAAAIKSTSGKTFYITDTKTQPTSIAQPADATAQTAAKVNAGGTAIFVTPALAGQAAPTLSNS